jgi:hypothetical protein
MVSTFTSTINTQLPNQFLPNPVVESKEYRSLNQQVQPRNNVNTGSNVWCHEDMTINTSLNNQLTGLPNPKTLVEPVIMPPIYDTEFWKPNDFMIPKHINSQPRQELYQNGYMVSSKIRSAPIREEYTSFDQRNQYTAPLVQEQCQNSSNLGNKPLFLNQFGTPSPSSYGSEYYDLAGMNSVPDKPFGSFPNNLNLGLPTNYVPQYPQQIQPQAKNYNENIFTSTLQPDVYTRSQVVQPDSTMSNLGISYTQPFLPTYSQLLDNGGLLFTEIDPTIPGNVRATECHNPATMSESDMYDPRLTGYGSSNRYYLDPLTSRPKYMYDDVDLVRQNQFITRNALDFTDFGLQTGPQPNPRDMKSNMEIRNLAQQAFLDNALSFRTELQERLMKKNSNRAWQQKQSPIIRNQYTRGGSSAPAGSSASIYHGPRG